IHGECERPQYTEGARDSTADPFPDAEAAQRAMAKAGHKQWKLVVLVALDDTGADPAMLARQHVGLVEEHGLADAAQAVEDEAARVLAGAQALEGQPEIVQLRVPSGQEWGSGAGFWGERVLVAAPVGEGQRTD